ncbi:MAG: M28 family peptidase, partial [Bacteroidota bacterium]|nr:M28 family peptidase [Bacteroidota bacterium]
MKFSLFVFILLVSFRIGAQPMPAAAKYAATIEAATIKKHVYALASDAFEGRETGTEGNKKASDYIAEQFLSYQIPFVPGDDNYFQEVSFTTFKWTSMQLLVKDKPTEHLKDFLSVPQYFPAVEKPIQISSLAFLGYGIDDPAYSDYAGKNVVGKHLLVYGGEPRDSKGKSRITKTDSISLWAMDFNMKIMAAKKAGAASVWIIDDQLRDHVMNARKYFLSGATQMTSPDDIEELFVPHALISPKLAEEIIGKKRGKIIKLRNKITSNGISKTTNIPVDIELTPVQQVQSTPGRNVLAFIEGSDPILKNEVVVVSAHYDHLGKRGKDIYFGADDNASGTSAVLEIAQAMAIAKSNNEGPRRSVLCLLVTGEEKGLLGSQYYSEHPVFPLSETVADINIDMIGRTDATHDNSNYTYVIGADRLSSELHQINEYVNKQYTKLDLDY